MPRINDEYIILIKTDFIIGSGNMSFKRLVGNIKLKFKTFRDKVWAEDADKKRNFYIFGHALILLFSIALLIACSIRKMQISYVPLSFTVGALINLALLSCPKKGVTISSVFSLVEGIALFLMLIFMGARDEYSIMFCLAFPVMVFYFFNLKTGVFLNGLLIFILLFFTLTPVGKGLLPEKAVLYYQRGFADKLLTLYCLFSIFMFLYSYLQHEMFGKLRERRDDYKKLARHDYVTGLYNRVGFYSQLENEVFNSTNEKISIGICDIDDFKGVNDRYGHSVGDMVIKEFANTFVNRHDMISCRFGGDEFLFVYFNDVVPDEELMKSFEEIKNTEFPVTETETIKIKFSAGVCRTKVENIHSISDIDVYIGKADSLLYQAKRNGKNIILFDKE